MGKLQRILVEAEIGDCDRVEQFLFLSKFIVDYVTYLSQIFVLWLEKYC